MADVKSNTGAVWMYLLRFAGLAGLTVTVTYFAPPPVKTVWYILLVVFYFMSTDEAFWLAFFLATVDGFVGFFGLYATTINILPGLPSVELAQIYIILSVIKASRSRIKVTLFYNKYLQILFLYMIFLVIWGQMMGFTGGLNVYLRVVKGVIPMLLFYSLPRLITNQDSYDRFFRLIFIITLLAFAAQIFTLLTGISPLEAGIGVDENIEEEKEFRVFFNVSGTLMALFGSLYYLSNGKNNPFNRIYLLSIAFVCLGMAIISATRGWIISFSLIILLTVISTGMVRSKRILGFVIILVPILILAFSNPIINRQISYSKERLSKIGAIAEGDLSAEGTLQRLEYRSVRVMNAWKENPIFGWGFSDKGYQYGDGHVGNQSLLAMTGILGFALLNGFLIFFVYRLFNLYLQTRRYSVSRSSLLVMIIFLAGWFIIHSTSGQQFNFIGMPVKAIPLALFFSFGAFQYKQISALRYGKKI